MNAVESRLRAARLFSPLEKQDPIRLQYLYINVHMHGPAFCVNTELLCNVENLGYGLPGAVVTVWKTGGGGTHGGNGQYILGFVSEFLDEFIAKYLRVNEADCSR